MSSPTERKLAGSGHIQISFWRRQKPIESRSFMDPDDGLDSRSSYWHPVVKWQTVMTELLIMTEQTVKSNHPVSNGALLQLRQTNKTLEMLPKNQQIPPEVKM